MAVGRPPKPTFLHVIEGTLRPCRHRKRQGREPKPVGDLQDPPAHLSEAQRGIWVEQLRNAPPGLLKRTDWADFLAWVVACDIHRQAAELLAQSGALTVRGARAVVQNPLIGIMNAQAQIMAKLSSELGFSPVSRARVTVDPRPATPNPFDEFSA